MTIPLPTWATELISLYESNAVNQFVLYGNVDDRFTLPLSEGDEIGTLNDFLLRVLLGQHFDVVLSYDLGNGIRILNGDAGRQRFAQWPSFKANPTLPKEPRAAMETLTHYFRYVANRRLQGARERVACIVTSAQLVAPNYAGGVDAHTGAIALLMREWSRESLLVEHDLATFLVTENESDLHPLLANNPRAANIKIPLPTPDEVGNALTGLSNTYPVTLEPFKDRVPALAGQLSGATLGSVERMLKTREHAKQPLKDEDLVDLKKKLIEQDSGGLIEFIESKRTLDDLYGQEKIKAWLRADIELWRQNDLAAMPMGYLLCGPVGTGKTFMVECLAGEAGVPVVKLKNFRDKWIGSTEGNLEKIFRLLQALGRTYVFVDEADQALGKRDSGSGDSGLSGRIYSMLAEEMSNTRNRGKIVWILASSRPDLIEVDLKRPGRIDVKIPIFPTTSEEESFRLIKALCKRRDLALPEDAFEQLKPLLPLLLTPGVAEALAVKTYRLHKVAKLEPVQALKECLEDYQPPVAPEILGRQMDLAIREASDLEFVPPSLRPDVVPHISRGVAPEPPAPLGVPLPPGQTSG
jgi:hypothetical protein